MSKAGTNSGSNGLILFTVALASFMVNLDTSIVSIALPTLSGVMQASSSEVSRIILFYLLAIVSTLLFFGRLGDRIGRKPVFAAGYGIFTAASVLCGVSSGLNMLVAMRFLQGIGGAMLFATMSAIIIENVDERHRGRAFSSMAMFSGVGVAVGAPLGGFIVGNIGWKWIFFINLIPGMVGMYLASTKLKKLPGSTKDEGFDVPGILTSSLALLTLIIAMNSGRELGWFSPLILGLVIGSIILSILFILREKRARFPLVKLNIFSNLKLTGGLLTKLGVLAILNGTLVLFPFFLEKVLTLSTSTSGLLLGIFPILVLFGSPVSGSPSDRLGSGRICSAATMLILVSSVMFLQFSNSGSLYVLIPAFVIFGFGVGLFFPANMKLVMGQATAGREGIFTAINSLANFLGAALGVAFLETVFSFGFPAVHDFSQLPSGEVASGFLRAMIAGVVLSALTVSFAVWSARRTRTAS